MKPLTLPMFFTLAAVIIGAMAINYFVGGFGSPEPSIANVEACSSTRSTNCTIYPITCNYDRLNPCETTAGTGTVRAVSMASEWYSFEPKDDITAPELAKAVNALLPSMNCRSAFTCPDVRTAIANLPSDVRRHFVRHDD